MKRNRTGDRGTAVMRHSRLQHLPQMYARKTIIRVSHGSPWKKRDGLYSGLIFITGRQSGRKDRVVMRIKRFTAIHGKIIVDNGDTADR